MTNKNSTKKALITSALCLLLCVSMLVGATFAWFTDSVSTTNNIITAGNLDVNLYWSVDGNVWTPVNSDTNIFKTETLWEPGHTEVVYFKVVNEGTLALKYDLQVNVASEVKGTNVAGEEFKLSDYILYNVTNGVTTFANSAEARGSERGNKLNAPYNKAASLEAGASVELTMVVFMPTTVGNEANYLKDTAIPTINLGINLFATQHTFEEDSYGPEYDAGALVCDVLATPETLFDILTTVEEGTVIGLDAGEYIGKITVPQNNLTFVSNGAVVDSMDLNGKNGITIDGLTFVAIYDQIETSTYSKGAFSKTGYVASITNTTSTAYGADDVVIKNCTFMTYPEAAGWGNYDPATYCAIDFEDAGRVSGASDNITIENCVFEAPAVNHIRLNYVEGNIVIRNNKFVGATSHHNINASGNDGDWLVTGNSFSNWADGEYAFGTSRGGSEGITTIEITNNTFSKSMSAGEEIPVLSIKSSYTDANSQIIVENNVANGGSAVIDAERRADAKYYMTSEGAYTVAENKTDLQAAIASGADYIDANGASMDLYYGVSASAIPAGKTVTIANAKIEGTSYGNGVNGTIIFENCTFTNSGAYSIHFDNGTGKVIFNNCTLEGWCTFGAVEVVMNNCTIKGNGTYALVRSYKAATLTNCVFDITNADYTDEYAEGVDCGNAPSHVITLIGCTNANGAIEEICNAAQLASGNIVIQ